MLMANAVHECERVLGHVTPPDFGEFWLGRRKCWNEWLRRKQVKLMTRKEMSALLHVWKRMGYEGESNNRHSAEEGKKRMAEMMRRRLDQGDMVAKVIDWWSS